MTQPLPPQPQPAAPVQPSPRFPRERIVQLFEVISGVQVVWRTRSSGWLGQRPGTERAWLEVSTGALRRFGVDELRQQFDAVNNVLQNVLVGQRGATLTLDAWSVDPNLEAIDLLERVAFRLRTARARALMVPTIALQDIQPIVGLPGQASEDRETMRASMDVRILYVLSADPLDPDEGEWIETVAGGGPIPGTLT